MTTKRVKIILFRDERYPDYGMRPACVNDTGVVEVSATRYKQFRRVERLYTAMQARLERDFITGARRDAKKAA